MRTLLTLIIIVTIFSNFSSATSNYGVNDISYTPSQISKGSNITISVTLDNTENIQSVRSFYCRIEPDYICHLPILDLTQNGSSYSTTTTMLEEDNEVSGFNIVIFYDNGSELEIPTDVQLDFGMRIVEPIPNTFYYVFNKNDTSSSSVDSTPPSSSSENAPFGLLAVLFAIPVYERIKNRSFD